MLLFFLLLPEQIIQFNGIEQDTTIKYNTPLLTGPTEDSDQWTKASSFVPLILPKTRYNKQSASQHQ